MADLADIRATVYDYISKHFHVTLAFVATEGSTINVGEKFAIEVTVQNLQVESDINFIAAVPVANVVCEVTVANPSLAKLIVPSDIKATTPGFTGPIDLTPGAEVASMTLHPVNSGGVLVIKPLALAENGSAKIKFQGVAKSKGKVKIRTRFSGDVQILPGSSAPSGEKEVTIAE